MIMGLKFTSPHFFSTFILSVIYYLIVPSTLSSQSSIEHQDHDGGLSDLLDLIKTEFGRQNHRIALLEVHNRNQDEDIDLLKVDNLKIHHQIDRNKGEPLNEVDELSYENDVKDSDDPIKKKYQKRASRLIPISLLFNNEKEIVPRVPFNCSDLNKMGHTVNGIYLVKQSNTINGNSRVNVVLCDFQPPVAKKGSTLPVIEERLGFLDLKPSNNSAGPSTGIYFYVQRGGGPTAKDGVIRFHKEHLNIGKGMNITTGIFTAPKAGIYHFALAIEKEARSLAAFHIFLRVNKVKIALGIVSPGPFSTSSAIPSILKLKKGDRVDVWKPNTGTIGDCTVLGGDAAEPHCHHFTGWLLKEDI